MKPSGNFPMDGEVHVDGFVAGGKEPKRPGRSYGGKKKKVVCAVELTKEGKVKRFYSLQIKDFSAKSLRPIFERHIERYLNEYSYRTNRSQSKQTIFHNLVKRMVSADKIYVENLI